MSPSELVCVKSGNRHYVEPLKMCRDIISRSMLVTAVKRLRRIRDLSIVTLQKIARCVRGACNTILETNCDV